MKKKNLYKEKIILTNNNIEEIYQNIPKIIKKYQKKHQIELIYKEEIKEIEKKTEIEEIIHAINIKDRRKRYTYIYDTICDKLDKSQTYCRFQNGLCDKYRHKNLSHCNGCCETSKGEKCKYLGKNGCQIKCISCKFFICDYLKKEDKKRVKNPNSFLLSKYFFNLEQKMILLFTFFTTEEEIIDKLTRAKFKKS
ncbi:MAG: hypothetical protein HFJ38_01265 [Bacilli bacterium]|nr:hypothetical protein [Bacilli bacterium]